MRKSLLVPCVGHPQSLDGPDANRCQRPAARAWTIESILMGQARSNVKGAHGGWTRAGEKGHCAGRSAPAIHQAEAIGDQEQIACPGFGAAGPQAVKRPWLPERRAQCVDEVDRSLRLLLHALQVAG
jgi:hypothetical protein